MLTTEIAIAADQQAVRARRHPLDAGRAQPRPPLAQRPHPHAARPGALEILRDRQLLPERRQPAAPRLDSEPPPPEEPPASASSAGSPMIGGRGARWAVEVASAPTRRRPMPRATAPPTWASRCGPLSLDPFRRPRDRDQDVLRVEPGRDAAHVLEGHRLDQRRCGGRGSRGRGRGRASRPASWRPGRCWSGAAGRSRSGRSWRRRAPGVDLARGHAGQLCARSAQRLGRPARSWSRPRRATAARGRAS